MKKLITLLAAAVMALLPVPASRAAEPESMDTRETREYKLRNFDGLDISWIYKVELTRASHYSVSIDAPDFILPYLRIEVRAPHSSIANAQCHPPSGCPYGCLQTQSPSRPHSYWCHARQRA